MSHDQSYLLDPPTPVVEECSATASASMLSGSASELALTFELVWDSDMILRFQDADGNKRWKCRHCGHDWSGQNHTKALGHVTGYVKDMKACSAVIPAPYRTAYLKIYKDMMAKKWIRRSNFDKLNFELTATEDGISDTYSGKKDRKRPPEELASPVINLMHSPMTDSKSTACTPSSSFSKQLKSANKATFQTTLAGASGQTSKEVQRRADISVAHWILANNRPHNTAEDPLFARMLKHVQQCGPTYKPPNRNEIGGALLDSTFDTYYEEEFKKLMDEIEIYGVTLYGDGATVHGWPLINILASSPNNSSFVADVIDCTGHQQVGGKKDAKFIAMEMLKYMMKLDPRKQFISQIVFDGASNVQKAGQIMAQHYPRAEVNHGVEHVVALVMGKFVQISPLKEYSKFSKLVSSV